MSDLISSRTEALRAEYERTYSERVLYIQKFYEMKYETLHDAIQQVYTAVLQDDLLKTLKKDATTSEFIIERVKELFEEVVASERQLLIERLGQQLTDLRGECIRMEQQNAKFSEVANSLNQELMVKQALVDQLMGKLKDEQATKRTQSQSVMLTTERELGQLRKSLSVLEVECDHLRTTLKERDQSLKAANNEIHELQHKYGESEKRYRQLEGEYQDLRKLNIDQVRTRGDSTRQVSLLEKKIRQLEANSAELEEVLRRHYKEKSAQYKSKIEKYKEKVNDLTKTVARGDKQKSLQAKVIEELEGKIAVIVHECDSKLNQQRNKWDQQRVDMERKHDFQMKESQMHYEKLLETKVKEVESQAQNSLAVMQQLQKQFRSQITSRAEDYEHNYIKRERYELIVAEKDELIAIVRARLEEREAEIKELNWKMGQLSIERDEAAKQTKEAMGMIEQHEQVFAEMNDRKRQLEGKLEQMLAAQKKTRRLSVQFENRLALLTNQKQEKERKLVKKSNKYIALEGQMKDLKDRQTELEKRMEDKERELLDLQEKLKKSIAEKDEKDLLVAAERKQAEATQSDLVAKLSEQKRDYQHKLEKLKNELSGVVKELEVARTAEGSYQQECYAHRQTSQKLSIAEKELQCQRNLQAANQMRFKDALNEHMTQVQEAKQLIDKLSREYKEKSEQGEVDSKRAAAMQQRLDVLVPVVTKYKRMSKTSMVSLETLTREIASLKDYIASIRRVYLQEMTLWTSILQRDFEDLLRSKDIEFINLKKQLAESQTVERSAYEERFRAEFNMLLAEKASTISELKDEVKQKQAELQQQQKSGMTTLQCQEELTAKLRAANSRIEELAQELLNEKRLGSEKLQQLRTGYERDRQRLVTDIDHKNSLYQTDFKELDKALLTLKSECESLRQGLDKSKRSYSQELESMKKKKEALEGQLRLLNDKLSQQQRTIAALRSERESIQLEVKSTQKSKATESAQLTSQLKDLELQLKSLESDKHRLQNDLEAATGELATTKSQLESSRSDNKRLNDEIGQMNTIIGRTVRNTDNETLRMARHLDNQTKELTTKVKELRRLSTYLGSRQPNTLRS